MSMNVVLYKHGKRIVYHNIPAAVARIAIRYNKSPIGTCECGRQGYANHNRCICEQCKRIDSPYDVVKHYGTAGSNIHRRTGKELPTGLLPYGHSIRIAAGWSD